MLNADDESIEYGVIANAETGVANDYWYVDSPKGEVLIPAIKEVVIRCDVENNKVYIKPLRGLFDDED